MDRHWTFGVHVTKRSDGYYDITVGHAHGAHDYATLTWDELVDVLYGELVYFVKPVRE